VLAGFARAIRPFLKTRSFIPSGDIGTNEDDISFMMKSIGLEHKRRAVARELSGFYTGVTVFTSAVAAARHIGLDLSRASVAIEGFGNVGMPAAREFWQKGVKVKAISTSQGGIYDENGLNIDALIKLQRRVGSQVVKAYKGVERIDKSRLAELDVDIFLPCAQPFSIDSQNAGRISASIISPGANAPVTDEAEKILFERKILLLPDFVSNCGGVFGSSMKLTNLRESYIIRLLQQKIDEQMSWVIESAEKENLSPCEFARRVALERFSLVKVAAENKSLTSRCLNYALKIYRRGIVPPLLTAPVAHWYFKGKFS
jgi:glutamate dehydrogenase/leucine dehydrogenase